MKLIKTIAGAWVNPDFVQTWTPVPATVPGEPQQYELVAASGQTLGRTHQDPTGAPPAPAAPAAAAEAPAVKAKPRPAKPTGKARRGKG